MSASFIVAVLAIMMVLQSGVMLALAVIVVIRTDEIGVGRVALVVGAIEFAILVVSSGVTLAILGSGVG